MLFKLKKKEIVENIKIFFFESLSNILHTIKIFIEIIWRNLK